LAKKSKNVVDTETGDVYPSMYGMGKALFGLVEGDEEDRFVAFKILKEFPDRFHVGESGQILEVRNKKIVDVTPDEPAPTPKVAIPKAKATAVAVVDDEDDDDAVVDPDEDGDEDGVEEVEQTEAPASERLSSKLNTRKKGTKAKAKVKVTA